MTLLETESDGYDSVSCRVKLDIDSACKVVIFKYDLWCYFW